MGVKSSTFRPAGLTPVELARAINAVVEAMLEGRDVVEIGLYIQTVGRHLNASGRKAVEGIILAHYDEIDLDPKQGFYEVLASAGAFNKSAVDEARQNIAAAVKLQEGDTEDDLYERIMGQLERYAESEELGEVPEQVKSAVRHIARDAVREVHNGSATKMND